MEPVGVVEARVGEDVVGEKGGMLDVAVGVGLFLADGELLGARLEVGPVCIVGGGMPLIFSRDIK